MEELEGVQCGSCGAHTAVVDAEDPHCGYCASVVELPRAVRARAAEIARSVDRARDAVVTSAAALRPERPVFTTLIGTLQLLFVSVMLAWWFRIQAQHQPEVLGIQQLGIALSLVGPVFFWVVARDYAIDRALARTAKLSFAQLVVKTGERGVTVELRCPSCGAHIEQTRLRGLTLSCNHCRTPLLAPSELVDATQRKFYRRVLALRGQLERRLSSRGALMLAVGAIFLVGTFWFEHAVRMSADDPTITLAFIPLSALCIWVYWVSGMTYGGAVLMWTSLPFLLGPSSATVIYFLEWSSGR